MRINNVLPSHSILASINSSASVIHLKRIVAKGDLLQLDFPISVATDGNIVYFALVGVVVDTSKDGFTTIRVGSNSEREEGLIEQTLINHIVKRWHNTVDGNRIKRKTQDSVKPSATYLYGTSKKRATSRTFRMQKLNQVLWSPRQSPDDECTNRRCSVHR